MSSPDHLSAARQLITKALTMSLSTDPLAGRRTETLNQALDHLDQAAAPDLDSELARLLAESP
jgi:hypothetical protein